MSLTHTPEADGVQRPSHRHHAARLDPEAAILGGAFDAARHFLIEQGRVFQDNDEPLAKEVREHIFDHRTRAHYVDSARTYLRNKTLMFETTYDVVVVGAGIHAAMFVYTAKQANPDLNILIVEKSNTICSTFCKLCDSLVLNSPTFSKVSLNANIAPGHFIQLSDFDELAVRAFPTAKHLYELATMMLFHADADILFDFNVEGMEREGNAYAMSSNERSVRGQSVVVANGMGEQKKDAFLRDTWSANIIDGDDFIASCHLDATFLEGMRDKTLAIIGAGDTGNCVMEYLLPLTYPNDNYASFRKGPFVPALVYWIGQNATTVQEFYFANKKRYCHSGGIIEFFWDGETPFDLPAESWAQTKGLIHCVPEKLESISHQGEKLLLRVNGHQLSADVVVDCSGRHNSLSRNLLENAYEFIEGDITFFGGGWDEGLDAFSPSPWSARARRVASKLKGESIFLLGCAAPVSEMVDDHEARDGSLKHQEGQQSLTNSKIALEHTLPRTFAFAAQFSQVLRDD